jgi:hypothetical protein
MIYCKISAILVVIIMLKYRNKEKKIGNSTVMFGTERIIIPKKAVLLSFEMILIPNVSVLKGLEMILTPTK